MVSKGKLGMGALFLLLIAGLIALIHYFLSTAKEPKKNLVQQISLIKPPPPKVEEKPPEPPKEIKKEEVKLDQPPPPEPMPQNEPPPSQDLGVDAKGTAGSDSFGLVGNPGGHTLIGGNGSKFGWYGKLIQQDVEDALKQAMKRLTSREYKVIVKLWLKPDGSVDRFDLATSTGSPDLDNTLKQALNEVKSVKEAPPDDMPQPVQLRISSR